MTDFDAPDLDELEDSPLCDICDSSWESSCPDCGARLCDEHEGECDCEEAA